MATKTLSPKAKAQSATAVITGVIGYLCMALFHRSLPQPLVAALPAAVAVAGGYLAALVKKEPGYATLVETYTRDVEAVINDLAAQLSALQSQVASLQNGNGQPPAAG